MSTDTHRLTQIFTPQFSSSVLNSKVRGKEHGSAYALTEKAFPLWTNSSVFSNYQRMYPNKKSPQQAAGY
jgi:hypothetical protein